VGKVVCFGEGRVGLGRDEGCGCLYSVEME
jgi:hypothetical protein